MVKLKAELHALRKRNAHLQSETAHVEVVPTEHPAAQGPSVAIKDLRADPALTARVTTEVNGLELSSNDSEDEGEASNKKSARGKKLKSGKRLPDFQVMPGFRITIVFQTFMITGFSRLFRLTQFLLPDSRHLVPDLRCFTCSPVVASVLSSPPDRSVFLDLHARVFASRL